jgi:glycerophosphoryl diester phosphodiesterase
MMSTQEQGTKNVRSVRPWGQRGLGCLTFLILLVFAYYGFYIVLRGQVTATPQLIAHRGGPAYNPENPLTAFQYAIDAGVDWIEFDVQRTQDYVLVVIHDSTVDRTTSGSGNVGELTLDEIQGLDAGNGEQVPTLDQVIALAKQANVGIMPEVKSPELYPRIAEQMVAAIEVEGYTDRAVMQSFDSGSLVVVREKSSEQAVCPLHGLWQFDLSNPKSLDSEMVCPMAEMVLLYPWMIRQAHREGKDVYVWFGIIEKPVVIRILLAMGADGLMVDDPIALAEIIKR